MTDDKLISEISHIVLGCLNGSSSDILEAVEGLKIRADKYEANDKLDEFFEKVSELSVLKEEILGV